MEKNNVIQFPLWIKDFNETINERFRHMTDVEKFEACLQLHEMAKQQKDSMSPKEKMEFEKQEQAIQRQMDRIFALLNDAEEEP